MKTGFRSALPVAVFALVSLSGLAGAQGGSLSGSWQGALRCGNARIQATLQISGQGVQVQGDLRATRVDGQLPAGASLLLTPVRVQGRVQGNEVVFTVTGAGGTFPLLKATVKGGTVLAGTLPPQTGCSSLYFVRTASAAVVPATQALATQSSATQAPATDATSLTGVWLGRYICQQGAAGLLMAIQGQADGRLQIRFSFYPLPENPFMPAGTIDATVLRQGNHLSARQTTWVSRPQGFNFDAESDISVSDDGNSLSVHPTRLSGCISLEVERQH